MWSQLFPFSSSYIVPFCVVWYGMLWCGAVRCAMRPNRYTCTSVRPHSYPVPFSFVHSFSFPPPKPSPYHTEYPQHISSNTYLIIGLDIQLDLLPRKRAHPTK